MPHRVFEGNRHRTRFLPSGSRRKPSASWSPFTSTASSPRASSGTSIRSTNGAWNWKVLAQRIIPELESEAEPTLNHDSSTNNLIRRYRKT